MAYFLRSGTAWRVTSKESMDLHETLPAGTYRVATDPMGNFFLDQIDDFEIPAKLYGNTIRHTNRIINSYWDRPAQTGVLLNGEKGSGKTLLAKNISVELAKVGVPTIVINSPWTGDAFFKLLQDIDQPCVILFDEFEKVYDRDEQEEILTLLDGVFASKKLYLLTCNDKWRIDSHMRNRPGRIFYLLDFKGLDVEFIREYCEDNLVNKEHIESVCNLTQVYGQFNFDMLKALVEEMNRYNEAPLEALEMLNAKPEYDDGGDYTVSVVHEGKVLEDKRVYSKMFKGNPLRPEGLAVEITGNDDEDDWTTFRLNPTKLVTVDSMKGQFIFESEGSKIILTRAVPKGYDLSLVL